MDIANIKLGSHEHIPQNVIDTTDECYFILVNREYIKELENIIDKVYMVTSRKPEAILISTTSSDYSKLSTLDSSNFYVRTTYVICEHYTAVGPKFEQTI